MPPEKKPYVSFGCEMPLALACLVIDLRHAVGQSIGSCMSRDRLPHATGREYLLE